MAGSWDCLNSANDELRSWHCWSPSYQVPPSGRKDRERSSGKLIQEAPEGQGVDVLKETKIGYICFKLNKIKDI